MLYTSEQGHQSLYYHQKVVLQCKGTFMKHDHTWVGGETLSKVEVSSKDAV